MAGHKRNQKTPKWLEAARAAKGPPGDWLERALGRAGVTDAARLIAAGSVRVDGMVTKLPFTPVTGDSRVEVKGQRIDVRPVTRVLAFHKPQGLVTQGHDAQGIGTVFEGLAKVLPVDLRPFHWHAVGRLDRDTTGLLLFTTDERFVAHVTQPQTHLPKRYVATVGGTVTEAKLNQLRAGVEISDGATRPAKAALRAPGVVELTLTEGRFHQVKRMLGAVGLPTLQLHREAIGEYVLDVALGEVRLLEDDEVQRGFGFAPRQ